MARQLKQASPVLIRETSKATKEYALSVAKDMLEKTQAADLSSLYFCELFDGRDGELTRLYSSECKKDYAMTKTEFTLIPPSTGVGSSKQKYYIRAQ